ncbi:MAG: helix-turn-helix domain-containing protein [Clostridia bacterium]|nr:helix-turn-helix domain-containing protein [Clostridia bacterium]
MMEQELKIGERISELLTVKGIDNKTFAGSLGVNVSTVGRWKSNAKYMRLSQIIAVANYFACSLDFLVGRSDIVLDFQPQTCPPFYPHLRKLLKEKGISRNQINRETRIKSSHFVDWSNGADPHILSLIELADYLNVTLDMLAGREKI